MTICASATETPTNTSTLTDTATATPVTPTDTATATLTPISTRTSTDTETPTLSRTPTSTRIATDTETLTRTPTSTRTATPTHTPTDTPTLTRSATVTTTASRTSTSTPSPTTTATKSPTHTRTPTDTATPTGTDTTTSTATGTPTPTGSATATPSAPAHLVISEFRSRGPNGADDEFVELYNPSGAAVNIGAWTIKKSSSCGTSIINLVTIPANTVLLPGQHYLVAAIGSSVTGADQTYPASLADDGGVALVTYSGTVVDQAGMCTATQYYEGTSLLPLLGTSNQSYEREPGDATSCYDTDDNAKDFALISPANPQNKASAIVMCAGVLTTAPTDTVTPTDTDTTTSTATDTPTPTGSATVTSTATPTSTSGPSPTTTATPSAPAHLVISEFRSRGPNGADDEFIELYNPSGAAVNMGAWRINKSSSCGTGLFNLITIPVNTVLLPGQHYLVAATGSSVTGADQTYPASLADDGGVALLTNSASVVDQAGMCTTTQYYEGTSLLPLAGISNQSYERKPGGATSCYDTNDNAGDFALISPSNPQNKASAIAMCAGVITFTPTSTPTLTATPTPTSIPTDIPGTVVINEFLPHPHTDWNGDGTANTSDEYIELINMGTVAFNLNNWKLDNGVGGSSNAYSLPDITLLPRQIVHFFRSESGVALSDGGSTVRLLRPDGGTADIYTYPVVTAADRTWCRLPDGSGAWAFACQPSPGEPNTPIRAGTPEPTPEEGAGEDTEPACLMGIVPQSVLSAECNSPGSEMWGEIGGGEIWLESHWKYSVFVE